MTSKVQDCVRDVLHGKGTGPNADLVKEEWFRLAVRDEIEKARKTPEWKMKMKDLTHNGCLLNGD